jgi:beta-glucosidase
LNTIEKIKNLGIFILIVTAVVSCENTNRGTDLSVEDKEVEALLQKMTLEEKAGQMTNISLMALAKGDFWMRRDTVELDTAKMNELLLKKHVGSVQNLGTYPFKPAEWRKNIAQIQNYILEKSRLKIPVIYGIDAVHGANYSAGSTLFPQQLALAATWNPALAETTGAITSYEIKASGIPWNYAPVLDVSKQPLWGRVFETFGEDTYLTTVMGDAMIKGAQGDDISQFDKSAVCLKHFIGYGTPMNGKDRSPTILPERILRQYYLPPFESAVKNGALTVMLNSGSVNGIPSHADYHFITEILKGEMGFEGFTISDWEDVVNLVKTHQVAKDEKEAVKISVNAGMDMCMEPYDASFADYLIELVNEGEVPMSRVDDAVRRILKVKKKLGLFEKTMTDASLYPKFGSEEFAAKSFEAAKECLTLLKNENDFLPFSKNKKVLVTGVGANSFNYLNGAWTRTWGGHETDFNDEEKKTVLEAIQDKIGKSKVKYVAGTSYEEDLNTSKAVQAARNVDYVIIVLGEKPATEKPSDIEDLNMPKAQLELVKKIAKTGKPIVLVLLEARPRIISEIEPLVESILMAYLPASEGGRAIAEVLFGDFNPCGKLPYTYPRHAGSIWAYDHTKADERDGGFGFDAFHPQYEFGHGLSYTTFEYANLNIQKDTFLKNETIQISIDITNTGDQIGKEVVQLYTSDLVASVVPAVKQLRRFQKVEIAQGETRKVDFTLTEKDLAFVNMKNEWVTEAGEFKITIDTFSVNFYLQN